MIAGHGGSEVMSLFWDYPDGWFDAHRPERPRETSGGSQAGPAAAGLGAVDWIADRAVAALRRDPAVRGRELEIMVQNRVVILFGDVDSTHARTAASRRAWSVPGVFDVASCLTVRGSAAGFEARPR